MPSSRAFLALSSAALAARSVAALNPTCAPGGNFNLVPWELQLPIGNPGSPTTIPDTQLEGCSGYQQSTYFYTDSGDGAMVMYVPGGTENTGCVTTPNTHYCRTELRELNPATGKIVSWDPHAATNRLKATVLASAVDNGSHGTVIGQIHVDGNVSEYPIAKLQYAASGDIVLGVEDSIETGGTTYHKVGNVPLNTKFSYEIRYESNVLSVGINGGAQQVFATSYDGPLSYFKAGNYNQGTTPSSIHFYSVSITH